MPPCVPGWLPFPPRLPRWMLRSLCCLLLGHSRGGPHAAAGMELDIPKGSGRRHLLEDGEAVLRGLRAAPRPCRLQGPPLTCGEGLVHAALPCGHQVPGTMGALPSPSGGPGPLPSPTGPVAPFPAHTPLSLASSLGGGRT